MSRGRHLVKYVNRISGALLIAAGAYLTWYGNIEIQLLRGVDGAGLPDTFVTSAMSKLTTAIDRIGGPALAAGLMAVIAVLIAAIVVLNRSRRNPDSNAGVPPATSQPETCKEVDG